MSSRLSKDQIEDLIEYCESTPTRWRGDNMQICCPIHSESHASMGVSEEKQVVHCFACGFSGGFAWFLYNAKSDEFKSYYDAKKFLKDRYDLEYRELGEDSRSIKRYEDFIEEEKEEVKNILPRYKLAPYMCGKETYEYFYNRGFNSDDLKKFCVGRDLDNRTVVLPVFWEDNQLAGMLGRYIDKRNKNERYKIYNFPRGEILYPLNLFEPKDNTVILVEGQFDAIRMMKLYDNVLAKMGVELTDSQVKILSNVCDTIIYLHDNDERGEEAFRRDRKKYGSIFKFKYVDYPNHGKDPCEWSDEEIVDMIENAHSFSRIRRIMD